MAVSWTSITDGSLCGTGEQEETDVELSPEGPHHPAPRAAAPHLHLEVSLATCAKPGHPAEVNSRSSLAFPHSPEQFPMPSGQPQTARLGVRVQGSKSSKRQSFWGPPGCPRGLSPMSLPSSSAPVLHVLFVLSSCWDRLHVASCPAPLPAQSHHSDSPRLCSRSPFLHFYFYFSAKSTPLALCVPLCLP